ncbi:conserved hypothetical protein [Carnobacterium maltaromaticum]|uniref:helix-turn-helix domain-containing protein n=1 Tax=Carnobacterium maltaromaticum TaxID=2751 RepID=UPI00191BA749|nr:helix-turn-helix domain-containing protein [Carnobacterium maltaromaticum]CAD5896734.1 conserved hypothetical protein [Carnobacterium maltaromaticum]
MQELLELSDIRDLTLINFLYKENRWWTAEDLAKETSYTIDSIYTAIKHINIIFAEYDDFIILTKVNRGIYLQKNKQISIEKYKGLYLLNSLSFQLLDILFTTSNLSIKKLTNRFFISKSTLYRKLKIISSMLERNNLFLDTRTLKITGDELVIREFFYSLYWATAYSQKWPFHYVSIDILQNRVTENSPKIRFDLTDIEKMQILYRTAINFMRYQKKNFITAPVTHGFIDPIRKDFSSEYFKEWTNPLPKNVQKYEEDYLCLIFCTYPHIFDNYFNFLSVIRWHEKENTLAYQFTRDFISILNSLYPENRLLSKKNLFYQLLCNSIFSMSFPLIKSKSENTFSLIQAFKNANNSFFEVIYKTIHKLSTNSKYKNELGDISHFIYICVLILNTHININNWNTFVIVRIIGAFNRLSEDLLKNILINKFPQSLTVINSAEHKELLIKNIVPKYNLIISDWSSPPSDYNEKTPLYYWKFPPTQRDIEDISIKIREIQSILMEDRINLFVKLLD